MESSRIFLICLLLLSVIEDCSTSKTCLNNFIDCQNGGCAVSKEGCAFIQGNKEIICPIEYPILCPDLDCVASKDDCSTEIPVCPPHRPYECWNNECRKSFEECPTQPSCPTDAPLLCFNGKCVATANECKKEILTKCASTNKIRCYDGSCASSILLCPTHVYCGKDEEGNEAKKCWNGACVEKLSDCPPINNTQCPSELPFRCPDGTCRPEFKACTSISTCPDELPIKCFDNSCRASIMECPQYQSCGGTKKSCPDGTCAKTFAQCNTVVTCYSNKPFLCYDGTCKVELRDCPTPPKCEGQVLCPNGACASSRQLCKFFDACDSANPIRCEANSCTNYLEDCNNRNSECPIGYVSCGDGTCKRTETLCEHFECPKNRPHKCLEGRCVTDSSLCDDPSTGCPYNAKIKCTDGTCVDSATKCSTKTEVEICGETKVLCEDGSCAENKENCPLKNGCSKERSTRCADGTCINSATTECNPLHCSSKFPVQCPNGYCVTTSSECPREAKQADLSDCNQKEMFMCADGKCVESSEFCRPLFECDARYTKCNDGTCRVSSDLCPREVQCPESRSYRCSNTVCAHNEKECSSSSICPPGTFRCLLTGECIKNGKEDSCATSGVKKTGCESKNKIKCPHSGRCLSSYADCALASDACPSDDEPFLCESSGNCLSLSQRSQCSAGKIDSCPAGKSKCDTGRCVLPSEAAYKCSNTIGCPLSKPYRCSDGTCQQSSRQCNMTVACDVSKPFYCADRTCVADPSLCKVKISCDISCDNGICVNNLEECKKYADYCPIASPVRCPSGTCAASITECIDNFNIPSCQDGEFYCSRLVKCVKTQSECLKYYNTEEIIKRRNLESLRKLGDEQPAKEGVICYDGTMAVDQEKCPVVPACKIGQYRCESGACAYNKSACIKDEEYTCKNDQIKCPDGLCHKSCDEVAFNGCLVGQFQCSNGMCVSNELDCIGYSMCDEPTEPFRCISGKCVTEISQCGSLERLGTAKNVTYSFNKNDKLSITFAFGPKGRINGEIEIPSKGLNLGEETYSQIHVEEVSRTAVSKDSLYNNSASFLFNVSNGIKGSEGVLDYENSVMSPVFKIYGANPSSQTSFKLGALLKMDHNTYDSTYFLTQDYCLAKLVGFNLLLDKADESSHWECVARQQKDEQNEFRFDEFGVYAILLSPLREISNEDNTETINFFLNNIKTILIVFAIVVISGAIIFYIFTRVSRYRQKYHENLNKIALLQQQKQEYEQMSTDVFGQTLGDNILGIVYVKNPCYKVDDEQKGTSLEEDIEELQRKCKTMENQNRRLQESIDIETDKYRQIAEEIESLKK